jgi:hydrogenase maturation factor
MLSFKGKIPVETLRNIVFRYLGVKKEEVLLGPSLGEDGSIVRVGDKVLITSMDPITGAVERIGWLAVNINANDIATFGVKPSFFSSCILLPKLSTDMISSICNQMNQAAMKLGIAIIGGHSEVTPDLKNPIIVGCAMGITEQNQYVTSKGSKSNDLLILTKGAGIEGTAILATEKNNALKKDMGIRFLKSAERLYLQISVVEEALAAYEIGGVTAMHDPTEGGVYGGIHELADAANLGVKIFLEKIHVYPETLRICKFFQIDPFQLISSGALLISAKAKYAEKIVDKLNDLNIKAEIIGEFLSDPNKRIIVQKDRTEKILPRPNYDHLWLALNKTP